MAAPLEQLEAMRKVPENWDGYGGAAPRSELIDAAITFYRRLQSQSHLDSPYVTPTRIGGVLFFWEQGPHQLEVEIFAPDRGEFLYLNQDTGETATGTVVVASESDQQPFTLSAIMSALPAVPV
jgi:hypothetical protein